MQGGDLSQEGIPVARSLAGVPIRLTPEGWDDITRRHPEMKDWRERMLETLTTPDLLQQGGFGELLAIRF
ncbi:hypothetical protein HRbin23_00411 [bacterium HR23]|nr:hypothetical protein HRbin23_00411 [bacterium HR23]